MRVTAVEQAEAIYEWRQLFESLNGKVTRGRDQKSARGRERLKFWEETVSQFQIPHKIAQRSLRRRTRIIDELWAQLRTSEAADNGALLDKIAALAAPQQRDIADELRRGGQSLRTLIQKHVHGAS